MSFATHYSDLNNLHIPSPRRTQAVRSMRHRAPTGRCANFTTTEKQIFLKIIQDYRDVVDCPKLDKASSKLKHEGWAKVAARFNASPFTINRTAAQMRILWKNMRRVKRLSGSYVGSVTNVHRHSLPTMVDGVSTIHESPDEEDNRTVPLAVLQDVLVETTENAEPDTTNATTLEFRDELSRLMAEFQQRNGTETRNGTGSGSEPLSPRITKVECFTDHSTFSTGEASVNSQRSSIQPNSTQPPLTSNKLTLEIGQGDSDLLFLISLAPSLRKLNAEKSSRFKIQALQWLHDAEFSC